MQHRLNNGSVMSVLRKLASRSLWLNKNQHVRICSNFIQEGGKKKRWWDQQDPSSYCLVLPLFSSAIPSKVGALLLLTCMLVRYVCMYPFLYSFLWGSETVKDHDFRLVMCEYEFLNSEVLLRNWFNKEGTMNESVYKYPFSLIQQEAFKD